VGQKARHFIIRLVTSEVAPSLLLIKSALSCAKFVADLISISKNRLHAVKSGFAFWPTLY